MVYDTMTGVFKMHIQNFSIVAGSEACNARCPYCISKMTPKQGIELEEPQVNWRNFRKGAILARNMRVPTVMITGKGEPTLFPEQISKFMSALEEFEFPFIELQTNGILLHEQEKKYEHYLKEWYDKGMRSVAISLAHYEPEKNKEIFMPHKKNDIESYVKENGVPLLKYFYGGTIYDVEDQNVDLSTCLDHIAITMHLSQL